MTTVVKPRGMNISDAVEAGTAPTRRPRQRHWVASTVIAGVVIVVLAPIVFMVVTSLRPDSDIAANAFGLPTDPAWENYPAAARGMNYWRSVANTMIITVGTAVATVLLGSMCAWAISRRVRTWTRLLYHMFIAGLTIPVFVFLTPLYILLRQADLLNTYAGAIAVYTALNLPFAVFFYCSFLRSMPIELEESGRIDGAGTWRLFWSIVFPMLRPATATLGILVTLAIWNDLVIPLLLLSSDDMRTVTQATYSFIGTYGYKPSQLFPAVVLATIPVVALFVALQRHIVASITAGVGKG
jgi:raffinose/stachyose/melibiose transport system permease protein